MVWCDPKTGVCYRFRKSDGFLTDEKAPDGFTVGGYRRIRKNGRIFCNRSVYEVDKLKNHVGKLIRWHIYDPFGAEIEIFFIDAEITPQNFIDYIHKFNIRIGPKEIKLIRER